jgi:hypothetical protein
MPDQEEIAVQQELLRVYRRTLAHLLQQAAQYGGEIFAPLPTVNGIAESRENIRLIKRILRDWGVAVEDHLNDEARDAPITQSDNRKELRQLLERHFNEEELRTLCFDLGIDYDALPGTGKAGKARELVAFSDRRGRIEELIALGAQMRPRVPWPDVPKSPSSVKVVKDNRSRLSDDWRRVRNLQTKTPQKHTVVPELRTAIDDLCRILDFVVVQGSYPTHHNRFVTCQVRAPTLHLNLPTEFPLILFIEEELATEQVREVVEQLSDLLDLMDVSADFGLVLVPGLQSRAQAAVNEQIRPAMKTDLIVLGDDFLDAVAAVISPRTILLGAILREVDLTRVSPFMAGGADLSDRMFFGREGELKNIAESIAKTSVAIICGRRMGKTTLLRRLEGTVLLARGHRCFFLDCQTVHDYDEFLAEMATAWEQPRLPFNPRRPNSFALVADALAGPNSKPPIFLLDEVDALLRYDRKHQQRLFKQMRALSLSGRARFIMTGERMVQSELRHADSPLFNFFGLKMRLSFLDWASVNKLIIEPLSEMQLELRDPLPMAQTIFIATSGHPYLVQRLCQELVLTISRQGVRVIGPEHIEIALDDSGYQEDYIDTVWGQAPSLARIITMLVGAEGVTLEDIRRRLERHDLAPPLHEIETSLEILNLYSVMERRQGHYYFLATTFPAMLRRAYGDDLETNIQIECEKYLLSEAGTRAHS